MPSDMTDPVIVAAESCGRDAWTHGVSIDGAHAYSDQPHIQQAWRAGWMVAKNKDYHKRGELPPVLLGREAYREFASSIKSDFRYFRSGQGQKFLDAVIASHDARKFEIPQGARRRAISSCECQTG
jgi:hypothetical protein